MRKRTTQDLLNEIIMLKVTNKNLGTQQALYYQWYLDECATSEKLRVEIEVLKRDKPA